MRVSTIVRSTRGFTVVEVVVTIAVLAILIAGAWQVSRNERVWSMGARDAERSSDVRGIAREFERYYRTNAAVSGPSYPSTTQVTSSPSSLLAGATSDILYAPDQTTVSLASAAGASMGQEPAIDVYLYQPLTPAGGLCTVAPCVRFNLYYRTERTNEIIVIESMRQQ